jgi:hypothetical protein
MQYFMCHLSCMVTADVFALWRLIQFQVCVTSLEEGNSFWNAVVMLCVVTVEKVVYNISDKTCVKPLSNIYMIQEGKRWNTITHRI